MLRINFLLVSFLIVISIAVNDSWAEVIKVGGYNYPPFMIEKTKTGIFHDVLTSVSRITGDTFIWNYYPYARLNIYFNKGRIDVEGGSSPAWTRNRRIPGVYTIPYYVLKDVIVFYPGKKINYRYPNDLKGEEVGTVRGYAFPQFKRSFKRKIITRVDASDEAELLIMLSKNRINQIFISKELALFWMKKVPSYRKFQLGADIGAYKIGIRVHPNKKHLIPHFNRAIYQLKKSGEIKRIFRKYR